MQDAHDRFIRNVLIALGNSGDTAALFDAEGVPVDTLSYPE